MRVRTQPRTATATVNPVSVTLPPKYSGINMGGKLILHNMLSPGDIVMLTAAVRDLHNSYPGQYITDVRTSATELWENNPFITPLDDKDKEVRHIKAEYPLIHQSNQLPYHFIHGFRKHLEEQLGLPIKQGEFKGDIHISEQEKRWLSAVDEHWRTNGDPDAVNSKFWIIVAGGKKDFTAKHWDPERYQQVVDHFKGRIQFVQVGDMSHIHKPLDGVINMLGKTTLRQLVRLVYHSEGVVCPVTLLMTLAAAVPTKHHPHRKRPCIVIAGGREPVQWQAYPGHQYLNTIGMLNCCESGGCWKSRVVPLNDNDKKDSSLCLKPVQIRPGHFLPKCMDMITSDDVIRQIEGYLSYEGNKENYPRYKTK